MKAKLSSRTIQALRASDNPFEVVDLELKGFLLRVQPSGAMSYYFSYRNESGETQTLSHWKQRVLKSGPGPRPGNSTVRTCCCRDDIQAEKKRERKTARLAKSRTLDGFLRHKYEPWATSQRKSGSATVQRIRSHFLHLMNRPLYEINLWVIEKWRSEQLKSGKAKTTIIVTSLH